MLFVFAAFIQILNSMELFLKTKGTLQIFNQFFYDAELPMAHYRLGIGTN